MSDVRQTILCISTQARGSVFIEEADLLRANVLLLTVEDRKDASWPRESLADILVVPNDATTRDLLDKVTYAARHQRIDRVVSFDAFHLETASLIREHMRLSGMGQSTTRFFSDRLAMQQRAQRSGVLVPEFLPVLNYEEIRQYMADVEGPWSLVPRFASSKAAHHFEKPQHLWPLLDQLATQQSDYLIEKFIPGQIFQVSSVIWKGETLFSAVLHSTEQNGVIATRTVHRDSADARMLSEIHKDLLPALGMVSGVTHTEFVKSEEDGEFYFLETSAGVKNRATADVVEYSTGINLWAEWAKVEVAAMQGRTYEGPKATEAYAGSLFWTQQLAAPRDLSAFDAPEVVEKSQRSNQAVLILQSESAERISQLLAEYGQQVISQS